MGQPIGKHGGAQPDRILIALLAAGLLLRLALAWAPFAYLARRGPLIDDAFYSFSIARNLARGAGPTADGVHLTSGFQPLYTLCLVPCYRLSPKGSILPIHLALMLLALCGAATSWFIFRITRRFASRRGALFAVFVWTFSPTVLSQGANGLETGLLGLLVAVSLDFYLGSVRESPKPWRLVVMGLLLGLTFLARVDGILLAAAVVFDLLRLPLAPSQRLRAVVGMLAVLGITVSPYLAWLIFRFGVFLPESGVATRFLSLCYGTRFVLGARSAMFFPPETVPLVYYAGSLRKALQTLVTEPMLFPLSFLTSGAASLGWLGPRTWPAVGGAALLWLGNLWMLKRPSGIGEGAWRGFARVAGTCAALWVPAYAFGSLGQWWFSRYFSPLFLFCAILSGTSLDRLGEGLACLRRLGGRRFVALVFCVQALFFAAQVPETFLRHKPNLNVSEYVQAARVLGGSVPPGSRTGAFQSGTLGYFARTQVLNLDGVVNRDAARALREKRMVLYIQDEGIDAVMDWPWILEALLERRSPQGAAGALGTPRPTGPFLLILVQPAGEPVAKRTIQK